MTTRYADILRILRGNELTAEQIFIQTDAGLFSSVNKVHDTLRDMVPIVERIGEMRPYKWRIVEGANVEQWLKTRRARTHQSMPTAYKAAEQRGWLDIQDAAVVITDIAEAYASAMPELYLATRKLNGGVLLVKTAREGK